MLTLAQMPWEAREEDSRENEAVTVEPLWVLWVELHELAVENVGNGCHAPVLRALSACGSRVLILIARITPRSSTFEGDVGAWQKGGRATYMGAPGWPELAWAVASA